MSGTKTYADVVRANMGLGIKTAGDAEVVIPGDVKVQPIYGYYVSPDGSVAQLGDGSTKTYTSGASGYTSEMVVSQANSIREFRPEKTQLALAVASNPVAYRCIDIIARKSAEMPFVVRKKSNGEEIKDHPLLKALEISKEYYGKNLLQVWHVSDLVHGETYLEKVEDQYGRPMTLRWINNLGIEPYIYQGRVVYYEYLADETQYQAIRLPPDRVLFDVEHNPLDDIRGLSPTAVVINDINLLNHIRKYQNAHFRNNARAGGFLTPKQNTVLREVDQQRIFKEYLAHVQGADKSNKTLLMPIPMDFEAVQQAPSPEHDDVERAAQQRVCAGYGVPISLVIFDELRFQVTEEHIRLLYENTIIPRCIEHQEFINERVVPYFDDDDDVEFAYEVDKVRALFADQLKLATAMNARQMSGNMTINQVRAKFGEKPEKGGDMYFIPKAVTPIAAEDLEKLPEMQEQQRAEAQQAKLQARNNGPDAQGMQRTKREPFISGTQNELKQWRTVALKRLERGRDFTTYNMPKDVDRFVRAQLHALPSDATADEIKAIFNEARRNLEWLINREDADRLMTAVEENDLERYFA